MVPLLLDVDLDFLVDGTMTLDLEPVKQVWCPAARLLRTLSDAGLLGGPVHAFLDHHRSLAVWDEAGVRSAVVVHIDNHRDVYATQSGAAERPAGIRGDVVQCGDYLFHALREGMVEQVIDVVPDPLTLANASRDVARSCPADIATRIALARLAHLPALLGGLGLAGPPAITTVAVSPTWLPGSAWPEADALLAGLGLGADERARLERSSERRRSVLRAGGIPAQWRFPYAWVEAR